MAKDEEFEISISSRATSDDEEVDQHTEEGIEESQQRRAAERRSARVAGQAAGRSPANGEEGRRGGRLLRLHPGLGRAPPTGVIS
jgi:hypothetical protein